MTEFLFIYFGIMFGGFVLFVGLAVWLNKNC